MQAINGYLENGRFIPNELITLPKRAQVILVFNETESYNDKTERLEWLKSFHDAVKHAESEEMPNFPRINFGRELLELSDEG